MKRDRKYWPYLILLVIGVVFSAGYLALAQEQESAQQTQGASTDAQTTESAVQQSTGVAGGSVKSAVINLSKLAGQEALAPAPYREPRAIREPGRAPRNKPVSVGEGAVMEQLRPEDSDAPAQTLTVSPPPASSFKALEDDNSGVPPDTHGAVGPNHLVVALNTQLRIQTRTGTTISTVSLNGFWAALNIISSFDPKVLYDPFNNRWMITSVADAEDAASAILIGVSQTSDPTGLWKLYKVDADGSDVTWSDYPSIGFNKNWIVVSVNMFTNSDDAFKRSQILVFNKATLYAFAASASFKRFTDVNGFAQTPAITYDNTLNTLYLVEDWDGATQLRISSITGTAAAPVYSTTHVFPTVTSANSWTFGPPNGDDFAPQQGSTHKIQNNDSRIQNVVYRNGSLWCTHTVFLPNTATPTRSAVQWWQLTPTGTIQQRARIDDAVAPLTFYAFPSIAVNKNNDVLIGYSRFSAQQYASANYSFRAGTDPANTLRTDVVLKAGSAPYFKTFADPPESGRNRWGDYSNTVVDPLNDLDMWTVQEHAAPVSGGFSRWGTWWGRIAPINPVPLIQLGTVTAVDGNAGDPDTIIEPGENDNKLTLQLKNVGNGAATGISGTLSTSTAGVTITSATSAYPNLAAKTGVGNNSTAFLFNVASTVPCGQKLIFTLKVTYAGGGSEAITFSVPTGKPGVTAVEKPYTGTVKPIPDSPSPGVSIPLVVSGFTGNITDLNFKIGGTSCSTATGSTTVGIDHTWVGDLVLTLKSPQGTVVNLIDQAGGVNNSGQNYCNTTLDDESSGGSIQLITPAGAPYSGSFKPNSPLSAFDGQSPNGTWTLTVTDRGIADTGNVRAFSLIITPSACSTTALATPVEIKSDHALASLPAGSDAVETPSQMSFLKMMLQPINSTSRMTDLAQLGGCAPDVAAGLELADDFDGIYPSRIEEESVWTSFVSKRYTYLGASCWMKRQVAPVINR
jgi:subtilisin-like proprotein convertase family protein